MLVYQRVQYLFWGRMTKIWQGLQIFHFQIQRVSLILEMCLFALEGEFFVSIHGKKWMGSKVGAVRNAIQRYTYRTFFQVQPQEWSWMEAVSFPDFKIQGDFFRVPAVDS